MKDQCAKPSTFYAMVPPISQFHEKKARKLKGDFKAVGFRESKEHYGPLVVSNVELIRYLQRHRLKKKVIYEFKTGGLTLPANLRAPF